MFITKECDYGARIVRCLADHERRSVKEICDAEAIPNAYAYKILKKLEKAHIVKSYRGVNGGYELDCDLTRLTIYEIFQAVEDRLFIFDCVEKHDECPHNLNGKHCKVHEELCRVQNALLENLKERSMSEILDLES